MSTTPSIKRILASISNDEEESYRVGLGTITKIEFFDLPGPHCMIPYIRIWAGDKIHSEFARHHIIGVYYDLSEPQK